MDGDLSASSVPDQGSTFRFAAAFPRLEGGATVLKPLKDVAPVAIYGDGAQADGLTSQIKTLGGRVSNDELRPSLNIISLPRDGFLSPDFGAESNASRNGP